MDTRTRRGEPSSSGASGAVPEGSLRLASTSRKPSRLESSWLSSAGYSITDGGVVMPSRKADNAVLVRFNDDDFAGLRTSAEEDCRPLSVQVRWIVKDYLRRRYG